MLEGNKVNAYFYRKTKSQKGIKWSLVYHCEMSMPDKYRSEPMLYSLHFQLEHLMTSTYLEELPEQIDASMEVLEERMSLFAKAGYGWTLHQNDALILEMDTYEPLQGSSYNELPKRHSRF